MSTYECLLSSGLNLILYRSVQYIICMLEYNDIFIYIYFDYELDDYFLYVPVVPVFKYINYIYYIYLIYYIINNNLLFILYIYSLDILWIVYYFIIYCSLYTHLYIHL